MISSSYWDEFVRSVEGLNEFVGVQRLRRYQSALLNGAGFEIHSPFSPVHLRPLGSALLSHRVAYLFADRERFWLLTGALRFGHPLAAFCLERDGDTVPLVTVNKRSLEPTREQFRTMRNLEVSRNAGCALEMVVGHPNFAHHLWNELPAIHQWLSTASDDAVSRITVTATASPFGPLAKIFPRLQASRFGNAALQNRADATLRVRPGSTLIPVHLREAVVDHCQNGADQSLLQPIYAQLQGAWPVVWISLVHDSRAAENQMAFLVQIIARIFSVYSDAAVVLDGFSFPMGFHEDEGMREYREEFNARAEGVARYITELQDQVAATLGDSVRRRLRSISGLGLAEAVCVGSRCHYYISHAGTLQHKIAWLHSVPGFIHSPPVLHCSAQARWHSAPVEGGLAPGVLPSRFESKIAAPGDHHEVDGSTLTKYRIADISGAVDYIVKSLTAQLGHAVST